MHNVLIRQSNEALAPPSSRLCSAVDPDSSNMTAASTQMSNSTVQEPCDRNRKSLIVYLVLRTTISTSNPAAPKTSMPGRAYPASNVQLLHSRHTRASKVSSAGMKYPLPRPSRGGHRKPHERTRHSAADSPQCLPGPAKAGTVPAYSEPCGVGVRPS